jgi:hypothetical protein
MASGVLSSVRLRLLIVRAVWAEKPIDTRMEELICIVGDAGRLVPLSSV